MASFLKRKQQRAVIVSSSEPHGLPGGMSSFYQPQSSPRDALKKRKSKQSRVNHTFTPYFDGHLWRKYGQKTIKDATYPRLYFRCSYREDRHCMASKLLQQVNDHDPPLYEVNYTHEHTCNAEPVPPPDVVAEAAAPAASDGLVLSFGSSGGGHHHRDALLQQKRQHLHQCQPVPTPGQFPMMNFDSRNGQLHEKLAFCSPDFPSIGSSWPSWFPAIKSSPEPSLSMSYSDDDMLFPAVNWDSFSGLIDQFDDYSQFLGNC